MDTKGFDGDAELRSKLRDLMDVQNKAELGRARAEADGWLRVATRRLGHIAECESALAKRNERIRKLEKQVADLRAKLANAEVPTERERAILDMWPRFEDGEYVWFGDAVEAHNGGAITVEAIEFSHGDVCVKDAEDGDWDTSMYAMHPLKRPAPKVLDADGAEIKVGDTVWDEGIEMTVMSLVGESPGHVTTRSENPPTMHSIIPEILTHTRPDSWERLEEDAEKEACDYFGVECDEDKWCSGCPHLHEGRDCTIDMKADLVRRAKALAGAEVE